MNRRRLAYPILAALAAGTIVVAERLGRDGGEPTASRPSGPLPSGGSGATSIGPAARPAAAPAAGPGPAATPPPATAPAPGAGPAPTVPAPAR